MPEFHIGFTGTRQGMTEEQRHIFWDLMCDRTGGLNPLVLFHHGDCIGADEDAHRIAGKHPMVKRIVHPPILRKTRAFVQMKPGWLWDFDELRGEKDYLVRNKDIVNESQLMIATPAGFSEVLRSGTWAAIRYTRKMKKQLIIIWPDGETTSEVPKLPETD